MSFELSGVPSPPPGRAQAGAGGRTQIEAPELPRPGGRASAGSLTFKGLGFICLGLRFSVRVQVVGYKMWDEGLRINVLGFGFIA